MLLYGRTAKQLLDYFRAVLNVLKHHQATLKLKKCKWFQDRCEFVGISVYRVALKQPRCSYLVANNCMEEVQVTSNITVTLVLVPVELSISISSSHAATYVVNAYASQISV